MHVGQLCFCEQSGSDLCSILCLKSCILVFLQYAIIKNISYYSMPEYDIYKITGLGEVKTSLLKENM